MTVGIAVTKAVMDSNIGNISLQTGQLIVNWQQIYTFLNDLSDSDILALGYDSTGLTDVRNITQRAGEIVATLTGTGTIAIPHDYRIELAQWWGMGVKF